MKIDKLRVDMSKDINPGWYTLTTTLVVDGKEDKHSTLQMVEVIDDPELMSSQVELAMQHITKLFVTAIKEVEKIGG